MKRVLVTGATKGLGRSAVEMLRNRNIAVTATGRSTDAGRQLQALGADFVALDLCKARPHELENLLRDVDTVWHCAAITRPWNADADLIATNATVTKLLVAAAGVCGVSRFVFVSSPAVYFDYCAQLDVSEDFVPGSYINMFARTKAMAELCIQAAASRYPSMHCTILRPGLLFGQHNRTLLPRLAHTLTCTGGKLALPYAGRVLHDLTMVDNVVHAMTLASVNKGWASAMAFNITNQEPLFLCDAIRIVFAQELNWPVQMIKLPYRAMAGWARSQELLSKLTRRQPFLTQCEARVLSFDFTQNNSRAQQLLGYVPAISLEQGLQRTATWLGSVGHFRGNGNAVLGGV